MDWGEGGGDNPMRDFSSMPQVLGHEVVAEVVALGPEAEGVDVGDRVVLNPWLSCVPRGVSPDLPRVRGRRPEPVLELPDAADRARHPHRHVEGRQRRLGRRSCPRTRRCCSPCPTTSPDEVAVFADPFAVSLHAITRHPPPPGGKVLVYGAGALGTCAIAILRALYPDVEVGVVARFGAQADLAQQARRAPGVRARARATR